MINKCTCDDLVVSNQLGPFSYLLIQVVVYVLLKNIIIIFRQSFLYSVFFLMILQDNSDDILYDQFQKDQSVMVCLKCENGRNSVSLSESDVYSRGIGDSDVNMLRQYLRDVIFLTSILASKKVAG